MHGSRGDGVPCPVINNQLRKCFQSTQGTPNGVCVQRGRISLHIQRVGLILSVGGHIHTQTHTQTDTQLIDMCIYTFTKQTNHTQTEKTHRTQTYPKKAHQTFRISPAQHSFNVQTHGRSRKNIGTPAHMAKKRHQKQVITIPSSKGAFRSLTATEREVRPPGRPPFLFGKMMSEYLCGGEVSVSTHHAPT